MKYCNFATFNRIVNTNKIKLRDINEKRDGFNRIVDTKTSIIQTGQNV